MSREIEYVDPNELIIIGLDTDDRQEHPLFDERVFLPVDENLVKNILVYGIQQPVLVRKEASKMYVVDGRQRTRAARKASGNASAAGEYGVKVPVRQVKADDHRVQGIMISTNELRQEDDTLAKAVKAQRLFDMVGDIAEVAIAFGRTETTIRNWLLLVEADPRVHAAIKAGRVSVTAATEIARLKREDQKGVLEDLIERSGGNRVSMAQAQAAVTGTDDTKADAGTTTSKSPTAKKKAGKNANQQGIKRVWLRKALGTKAAKKLSKSQRAILDWFATGVVERGEWFDEFQFDAEVEMGTTKNKKALAKEQEKEDDSFPSEKGEEEGANDEEEGEDEQMTPDELAAELKTLSGK